MFSGSLTQTQRSAVSGTNGDRESTLLEINPGLRSVNSVSSLSISINRYPSTRNVEG